MVSAYEVHAGDYHLVSADIRNIEEFEAKLAACGIDKSLATLFIAECVLVYIETKFTNQLLKWISQHFPTTMFINYEQVCESCLAFCVVLYCNLALVFKKEIERNRNLKYPVFCRLRTLISYVLFCISFLE